MAFVGVLIQCLDQNGEPIKHSIASGFIRREDGRLWLYTAWHVVTGGIDPYEVKVPREPPPQRFLKIALQLARKPQPEVESIGGLQTLTLPLYDDSTTPPTPLWWQDEQHSPHADLNEIGLYVPFWHDLVRIELPKDLPISDIQMIDEDRINQNLVTPGEKCLIVGYPYGFSSMGPQHPTPIALTRFIAAQSHHRRLLLESIGAPGMSGGPVFVERGDDLLLCGIYTGSIYPDYEREGNEKVTALGTVCDMSLLLGGGTRLVQRPEEAVGRRVK